MVIKAWSCNFVPLLGCFVRQLARSLHTFLGMTFHIIGPREMFVPSFSEKGSFFCSRDFGFKHISVIVHNIFVYFTLSLSAAQVHMIQERCRFSQINVLHAYFHIGSMFCFFPVSFMSSTYRDKNSPFSRFTSKHSQFGNFPNHVKIELSRIAFSTIVLPKGDRTDFVQEGRLDLPYWTMISAICALVDVSKNLDI